MASSSRFITARHSPPAPIRPTLRMPKGKRLNEPSSRLQFGPDRPFSPSLFELCQIAGDFEALTDAAQSHGDLVSYAAGIIQKAEREPPPSPEESQ